MAVECDGGLKYCGDGDSKEVPPPPPAAAYIICDRCLLEKKFYCCHSDDRSERYSLQKLCFLFITLQLIHFATSFFGLFNPKSTHGSFCNPVLQRVLLIYYSKVARYVFKIRTAFEDADCNALEFDAVSFYACDDNPESYAPEKAGSFHFPEYETLMENLRSVLSQRNQIVDACRQGFGGELTPALLNVFRILSNSPFDAGNVSVCQFLSCMTTIGDSDGEYKSFSQRLADKFSRIFTTTVDDGDISGDDDDDIDDEGIDTPDDSMSIGGGGGITLSLSDGGESDEDEEDEEDDDDSRGFQYAVQKFYCKLVALKCVHFAVSFFEIFGSEEEEDNANPPAAAAGGVGDGGGQRLRAFQRVLLGHFAILMLDVFKLRKRYGDKFTDQRIRFTDPPTENGYAPERSVSAVAVDDIPSYTALMNNLTDYVSNQSKFFDAYHRGYGETAPTISKSFLTKTPCFSSVNQIINFFVSFSDSKKYKTFSKGLTESFNQFSVAAAAGAATAAVDDVTTFPDCWSGAENAEKRERFVSNVLFHRLSKGVPVSDVTNGGSGGGSRGGSDDQSDDNGFRIRLDASSYSGLKDEKFKYVADFVLSKSTPFSVLQYLYEKAVLNCPIRCGEELAKWGRDVFSTVQRRPRPGGNPCDDDDVAWPPLYNGEGKLTQSIIFDETGGIKLTFWFVKESLSASVRLRRREEFALTVQVVNGDVRCVYVTPNAGNYKAANFVVEQRKICDIKDPVTIDPYSSSTTK